MTFSLKNHTVLVTGSGQGIGRAIAQVFANAGANIMLVTRTTKTGEETKLLIEQAGGKAALLTIDLQDRNAANLAVQAAITNFSGLDIIIHNAALFPMQRLAELTDQTLESTLAVNLKTCFWLTQAALPFLQKTANPRVIITSSVTGPHTAIAGLAHYAASKAGVNGFIKAAALELAPYGITVNGVEPGLIATPAMANLGDTDSITQMANHIPLKRLGNPEDIANTMLFLASKEANYITGQTITVDGGALLPEIAN